MTVSITISGDSDAQLHEEALRVAAFFAPATPAVDTAKPAKGKKDKAPVQTDIEDVANPPEHKVSASVAAAQETTHDDVVAALSDVNGKKGMQAVRDIIGKFGAEKISQVKAEDRAAVVAAAKAAVA